ncbi:hypothetical protein M0804_004182 [Polistes exclamans]|nr:hypothetical protein M0804_004182 [Polistes exclamans]
MGLWRLWKTIKKDGENVDEENSNETCLKSGPKLLRLVSSLEKGLMQVLRLVVCGLSDYEYCWSSMKYAPRLTL